MSDADQVSPHPLSSDYIHWHTLNRIKFSVEDVMQKIYEQSKEEQDNEMEAEQLLELLEPISSELSFVIQELREFIDEE